ncbi:endonuclease domain-containing 1 protein-like [Triplophysa rosa]|uniref:Endonuclease domain-containing 1 protein n=1 Tax=Triplophysa rosa TaxID=992332 RepID=A0A9W7TMA9_TRIRA|nr:endonuclease domain-containing 1 protein-like [Triplophysa rosa]KAI7798652.1 hypothetical protein IRJ41_011662 [Triplophysa rosa]
MHLFVASVVCVLLALSFPGIISRLEDKFTNCSEFFSKGEPPVISGILENSEPQNNDYRVVCQKYKNKTRYATLYDTKKKIPVFSAYKYTGTNELTRPEIPWMIELQLEPSGAQMCAPFAKQARNRDYRVINTVYRPSALFPMNHTAEKDTAESTFTLTNSVPQNTRFKEGIWTLVENAIRENMDNYCLDNNNKTVAYVLTGAIPGDKNLRTVNIPSHMWTAFCCYSSATTSWVSQTYWTENISNNDVTNITLGSLEDLQIFLNETLGRKVELFNNNCVEM